MFLSMIVPIVGSILLILIAGLTPRRKPSLIRCSGFGVVVGLVWLITLNVFTPLKLSFPDAATTRVAEFGCDRLKQEERSLGQYVFVVEGSSPTSRAIDGDQLETELRSAGIAASVIQIALDGANHVERLQILREFLQALGAAEIEQLKRSRVILCREVEFYYDRDPFNKVESNAFTDRTLSYINLQNLPEIIRWFGLNSHWIGLIRKRDLVGSITAMEAFNLFRVGYLERIQTGGSLPPQNGFVPRETRSLDFNPNGPLPLNFPSNPSKTDLKIYRSTTAWVSSRDAEYEKLFGKVGVSPCFFSVTSWSAPMYRYNLWLAQSPKHQPFFNGDTEALRKSLADPGLWADELHLKPAGARIFTQALANYFIDAIKNEQL
jgi:hypothetical protein